MSPLNIAEIRRQEIMEHFYAVVSAEGFSGVSLAKVAARMDVNPSLLLHYFKSKEQMIIEFVEFIILRYEKVYIEILKEIKDPEKKIELLLDRLFARDWAELVSDRVFYECYALGLSNTKIRDRFRTFYSGFRGMLAGKLSELSGEGYLSDLDPGRAADFLIVLLEGKDVYANLAPGEESFQETLTYLKSVAYRMITGKDLTLPGTSEGSNGESSPGGPGPG